MDVSAPLDPRTAHPACQTYFMAPLPCALALDANTLHPSFFGAEYKRARSRHLSAGAETALRLQQLQGGSVQLMYTPSPFLEDRSMLSEEGAPLPPSLADLTLSCGSYLPSSASLGAPLSAYASEFERLRSMAGSLFSGSGWQDLDHAATMSTASETCFQPICQDAHRPKTSRGPAPLLTAPLPLQVIAPLLSPSSSASGIGRSFSGITEPSTLVSSSHTLADATHSAACALVERVVTRVVSSLVAMHSGTDYLNSLPSLNAEPCESEPCDSVQEESMSSADVVLQAYTRAPGTFILCKSIESNSGRVHPSHQHLSEWCTYAQTPINTGPNKRRFRSIASAYDSQQLVHPAFFGFTVRWRQDNDLVTEARYTHPLFAGYSLNRTCLAAREVVPIRQPNPYRWTPLVRGARCLICGDSMAGCPRCFELPMRTDGQRFQPRDLEFNPQQDLSISPSPLHTGLTTFKGVRLFRHAALHFVSVWVKDMPSGPVHRVVVEASDCVSVLWTMLDAHSASSQTPSRMLVLPTNEYLFEMQADVSQDDELNLGKTLGRIPLSRYGIDGSDSVALLRFTQYRPVTAIALTQQFLQQNSSLPRIGDRRVESNLALLPDLTADPLQRYLVGFLSAHLQT